MTELRHVNARHQDEWKALRARAAPDTRFLQVSGGYGCKMPKTRQISSIRMDCPEYARAVADTRNMNKLSMERPRQIIRALADGNSMRTVCRSMRTEKRAAHIEQAA